MSKSRGIVPPDSLPTHMSIDAIFFKSSYLDSYKSITETVGNRNTGKLILANLTRAFICAL